MKPPSGNVWGNPVRFLIYLLALACVPSLAPAAQVIALDVCRDKQTYHIQAKVVLNAELAELHGILTDFERLPELSPKIKKTQRLTVKPPFDARVRTVVETCVLIRCMTIQRVEDVYIEPQRVITIIVPEYSDFKQGRAEWQFIPLTDQVLVDYRASMDPAMWLPPVLGPHLLKQKLRNVLLATLTRLEDLALAQ